MDVASTPKRFGSTLFIWAMASATLLIGMVQVAPAQAESSRISARMEQTLAGILDALPCTGTVRVPADMSSFDAMTGANCYFEDSVAVIRVYLHRSGMVDAFGDWWPAGSSSRVAVWKASWFAVGPREVLLRLANRLDAKDTSHDAPPKSVKLSVRDDLMTTCMRQSTSLLATFATQPSIYRRLQPSVESAFPGVSRVIQSVARPWRISRLKHAMGSGLVFAAELAFAGQAFRDFCAGTVQRMQRLAQRR